MIYLVKILKDWFYKNFYKILLPTRKKGGREFCAFSKVSHAVWLVEFRTQDLLNYRFISYLSFIKKSKNPLLTVNLVIYHRKR